MLLFNSCKEGYSESIVGLWLNSIKILILLDRKLRSPELDSNKLDSMLLEYKTIRENVLRNKTKLNCIKRLTIENLDDIIESIEILMKNIEWEHITLKQRLDDYNGNYESENFDDEDEIRQPSLDGLGIAVQEMMDMKSGKIEKVFVDRDDG